MGATTLTVDDDIVFPPGACDTHVHVYDARCPVASTAVLRPPDASVADYRRLQAALGLQRVVLVQPTTYGFDNRAQLAAAGELGDAARLVVVVDERTPNGELERLTALGGRGARFHLLPGGALDRSSLAPVAERVAPYGWHVQVQLNGRDLVDHVDALLALPVPVVVDHVGRFMPPVATGDASFGALLRLLDGGRAWVKLSAPYESAADPVHDYAEVGALIAALVARVPERLLWASNWPHPGQRSPPDVDALRRLALAWLPDAGTRRRVLVDNAATLYGFPPLPPPASRGRPQAAAE